MREKKEHPVGGPALLTLFIARTPPPKYIISPRHSHLSPTPSHPFPSAPNFCIFSDDSHSNRSSSNSKLCSNTSQTIHLTPPQPKKVYPSWRFKVSFLHQRAYMKRISPPQKEENTSAPLLNGSAGKKEHGFVRELVKKKKTPVSSPFKSLYKRQRSQGKKNKFPLQPDFPSQIFPLTLPHTPRYTTPPKTLQFNSPGVRTCTILVPSLNRVRKMRFAF